jgi:hypothetical protein
VALDVAVDNTTERSHEIIDLSGRGAPNGISDTNSIYADCVDSLVQREEVNQVGPERILRREPDFYSLATVRLVGTFLHLSLLGSKNNDVAYLLT